MSVSMVLTLMYGNAAAAESGGQQKNKESQENQETQEISTSSNADQIVDTGSNVKPTETQAAKTQRAGIMQRAVKMFIRLLQRRN